MTVAPAQHVYVVTQHRAELGCWYIRTYGRHGNCNISVCYLTTDVSGRDGGD